MSDSLTDISEVWGGPHSATTSPHSPFYGAGEVRSNPKGKAEPKVPNAVALSLGGLAVEGKYAELRSRLLEIVKKLGTGKGSWGYFAQEIIRFLDNPSLLAEQVEKGGVTTSGNMKLPFAIWAEMPVVTCPGAGGVKSGVQFSYGVAKPEGGSGCAEWCYSLKGLRNPSVWFHRMKNTLAMTSGQAFPAIARSLDKLIAASMKKGKKFILRIYVDGDFRDQKCILGWMDLLNRLDQKWNMVGGTWKPNFITYGYSKSWKEFLALQDKVRWPKNYRLNVSSGSLHGKALETKMLAHPAARGRFVAVDPIEALTKVYGPQAKWPAELRADVQWWHDHTKTMGADPGKGKRKKDLPGMIAQSATYTLMHRWLNGAQGSKVTGRTCLVCPISCATCPVPMLGKDREANRGAIEATVRIGTVSPMLVSERAGSHLCYSAQGKDIIIGLH